MKTTRRRTSDSSYHSWETFRQFFEQNEESLVFFNHETCDVLDANLAACRLFGCSREEMVCRGLQIFSNPEERDNFRRIIYSAEPTERPFVMTYLSGDG